jgi:hypothetical protein
MVDSSSRDPLATLLYSWKSLLRYWAGRGTLAAAVENALGLSTENKSLQGLLLQFANSNFIGLPSIALSTSALINGEIFAYDRKASIIYLNEDWIDWLATDGKGYAFSALTEELGNYLALRFGNSSQSLYDSAFFADVLLAAYAELPESGIISPSENGALSGWPAPRILDFKLAAQLDDGKLDLDSGESYNLTFSGKVNVLSATGDRESEFYGFIIVLSGPANQRKYLRVEREDLASDGSFVKTISMARAAAQAWSVAQASIADLAGNSIEYDPFLPSSLTQFKEVSGIDLSSIGFSVVNSKPDINPPILASLSIPTQISDGRLDLDSLESGKLLFRGKILDQSSSGELGSGFDNAYIGYIGPNLQSQYISILAADLSSDGSFAKTLDFSNAAQGTWKINSCWFQDKAGNISIYDSSNPSIDPSAAASSFKDKSGFDVGSLSFTVLNKKSDISLPFIGSFSGPAQLDDGTLNLDAGESGILRFSGTLDERNPDGTTGSGLNRLDISFQNHNRQYQQHVLSLEGGIPFVLGPDGTFSQKLDFRWAEPGDWSLASAELSDMAGNNIILDPLNLDSVLEFKASTGLDLGPYLRFSVVNSGQRDDSPPVVTMFKASPQLDDGLIDLAKGESTKIEFSGKITDLTAPGSTHASGPGSIRIGLKDKRSGRQVEFAALSYEARESLPIINLKAPENYSGNLTLFLDDKAVGVSRVDALNSPVASVEVSPDFFSLATSASEFILSARTDASSAPALISVGDLPFQSTQKLKISTVRSLIDDGSAYLVLDASAAIRGALDNPSSLLYRLSEAGRVITSIPSDGYIDDHIASLSTHIYASLPLPSIINPDGTFKMLADLGWAGDSSWQIQYMRLQDLAGNYSEYDGTSERGAEELAFLRSKTGVDLAGNALNFRIINSAFAPPESPPTMINQAPNGLNLSAAGFNENIAAGTAVATLSTTDPDAGDTFSYGLVSGSGDGDNSAFSIDGNQLKIKASPDFESKSSYSIRLRTSDAGGLFFEKAVTLAVNDLQEGPAAIESVGRTILRKSANGQYVVQGIEPGSAQLPISKDGSQIFDGIYGKDWTVLAAEQINGVNQLLWKNTAVSRLHVWSLDSNWNWLSSAGWDEPSSATGQQLEAAFGIDLDGNGTVAAPGQILESAGSISLISSGSNSTYSAKANAAGSSAVAIKKDGSQIYAGIYGNDWSVLAAETVNGVNQLLWKNTSANRLHVWSLDGNWNWTSSSGWDEPTSAEGQQLEAQFGLDLDGNGSVAAPTTTVDNQGSVQLLQGSGKRYSVQGITPGAAAVAIKKDGSQIYAGIYGSDWSVLAAETVGGVNQLLWKNTSANRLHLWSLDSNWNWTSSAGWDETTSSRGIELESQFGLDLNGDGKIAQPSSSVEEQGSTWLLKGSGNTYSARSTAAGAAAVAIKKDGVQIAQGIYGTDWQVLAAETVAGVNQVLWKNASANRLHVWNLDTNWAWKSSAGWDEPTSAAGQQLEAAFGLDLDGNGSVAAPNTSIETKGAISLISSGSNSAYSALQTNAAGAVPTVIKKDGSPIYKGIYGNDWQLLAAETVNGVNQLLWKNSGANRLHVWSLDANWTWTASTGWDDPNSAAGQQLEAQFGIDLDGNGTVANPETTVESAGSIRLISSGSNSAYSAIANAAGSTAAAIKKDGSPIYKGIYGNDWTVLAAERVNGVNQVLWKNTAANRLHLWSLDTNWNWTASTGWDEPASTAGQQLEAAFGIDLDGNGTIAAPTATSTTIENKGEITLLKGSSNRYSALSTLPGSSAIPITNGGTQIYEGIYGAEWQVLAADSINGSNQLLWNNTAANRLHTWSLDANWSRTISSGLIDPNSHQARELEAQFALDLNGDGIVRTTTPGTAGVDLLTGSSADEFFSPLGVPTAGGVDQIISGGGRNQILLSGGGSNGNGNGNLYANAKEADYLLIDGFNASNDQLLLTTGKPYASAPLSLANISGVALFEDRNADGLYSSSSDELLVIFRGISSIPSTSILLS